ncbi:MAG TPA: FAD-dependent oxidoreductase [Halanaerobiales bacterium]|nr:FAD-dependent oxidoreductase [Halanaerobiales bacterium]
MIANYELVVVGGGPAGLAAALEARKNGVEKIIILERDKYLGGILQQCIHNGFGLDYFKEELTGPEYAERFITNILEEGIDYRTETMVIRITPDREIIALNQQEGLLRFRADTIVLAMGCRERTREAIRVPGERPAGIFSAGTAQRLVNIEGYMPGKEIVILGSGDIGLIMARRMFLEGAEVKGVMEIMPYSSGLNRNKVQCLDDFNIPLKLNHTITRINGKQRVESVVVQKVDEKLQPVKGTEELIKCDTVLFSVGLIPENELSREIGMKLDRRNGGPVVNELRETEMPGIFACGNVLHVHDLVDYVTEEGEISGKAVAAYLSGGLRRRKKEVKIEVGEDINYVVPHKVIYKEKGRKRIKLFMRVKRPLENARINISNQQDRILLSYKKDLLTPGEMVTVFLPESILDVQLSFLKISVDKEGSELVAEN